MKRLHLLVAGLCPDFIAVAPDLFEGLRLAGLRSLLARGQVADAVSGASLSAALARLFGLDAAAIAPFTLRADGVDPAGHWWMRADPVHLDLGADHIVLRDSGSFQLNAAEAEALIADLNAHFAGDVVLLAAQPQRWYARFQRPLDARAPSLDAVAGRRLAPDPLSGKDAGYLQRLGNEAQMFLHSHPVNTAREARGDVPVNGVWFWGGGVHQACAAPFDSVLADDFTARALANAAGLSCAALPQRWQPREHRVERLLVVLDWLQAVTLAGDFSAWRTRLQAMDADWFGPVLAGLRAGHIGEVVIEVPGRLGFSSRIERRAAWRIWRREHPICAALSRRAA